VMKLSVEGRKVHACGRGEDRVPLGCIHRKFSDGDVQDARPCGFRKEVVRRDGEKIYVMILADLCPNLAIREP
jgi:hypothetical protein